MDTNSNISNDDKYDDNKNDYDDDGNENSKVTTVIVMTAIG